MLSPPWCGERWGRYGGVTPGSAGRSQEEVSITVAPQGLAVRISPRTWTMPRALESFRIPKQGLDDTLFRSVFENTLEAIVITDALGRILEANAEACYLFGRTIDEMRSTDRSELIDVREPRVRAALTAGVVDGRFTGLLPLLRRDGSVFHADLSATRFTTPDGTTRYCAFVRDVAARDLAERALLASENRYRSLIETTGTVLIGVGATGTIFEWNREAERVYGCARSEALGKDFYRVFLPENARPAVR